MGLSTPRPCHKCKEIFTGRYCRPCTQACIRAWRKLNKPKSKIYARRHNDRVMAWVREQRAKPCTDCGRTFPWFVMDFDHKNGKLGPGDIRVAALATKQSFKRAAEEIAKCDLVCANCHKIRTHLRRK